MTCVFCDIVKTDVKSQVLVNYKEYETIVIEPLNPCIEGHRLFIPYSHTVNVSDLPPQSDIMSNIFEAIRNYTKNQRISNYNVIINNGELADQTVFHLHVHLIPRTEVKSVAMPWSHQWT